MTGAGREPRSGGLSFSLINHMWRSDIYRTGGRIRN